MKLLIFFCSLINFCQTQAKTPLQILNGPYKEIQQSSVKWEDQIRIEGLKNEVQSFIIKLSPETEGHLKWVWSKKQPIVSPKISVFRIDQILLPQSQIQKKTNLKIYDPLIPLNNMHLPKSKETTYYWIDIKIPSTIKSEEQKAQLQFGRLNIPVTLNVLNFSLPTEVSLPAYVQLSPWIVSLAHFGAYKPEELTLTTEYYEMLREHRLYTTKSWRDGINWKNNGILKYRKENKSVYGDSPSNIAYDFPVPKKDQPLKDKIIDLQEMEKWIKTQAPRKFFIYFIDEPSPAQLTASLDEIALIKKYAPSVKILVTVEPSKNLEKLIDIFVPVLNYYKPTWKVSADKEVWWYISCMSHGCGEHEDPGVPDLVLDRPESYVLSIGPLSWAKKIQGFLYFHANYNYQFAPQKDPWQNFFYFNGYGDGDLFYPGKPGEHFSTKHQPVPSIRLKLLRETSYLHQYLSLLQNKNPQSPLLKKVELEFNSVFKWPRTLDYYLQLRKDLFAELSKLPDINNNLIKN